LTFFQIKATQGVYIGSYDDPNLTQTSTIQLAPPQKKKKIRIQLKLKIEPEKKTVRTDISQL